MNGDTKLAMSELPLSGIRVVELAGARGEQCGRILADLGADVLKIEPPGGGPSRAVPPLYGDHSLPFGTQNANKRTVQLDIEGPQGRRQILELVREADIVLDTHEPGHLDGMGLGPADLRGFNPALIVTTITEFGRSGPYRDWLGTDFVHLAMSGVLARSGFPDEPPLMPPGSLPSAMAGVQAAWATLVAYWARRTSGTGAHVDASIFEATLQSLDPAWGMPGTAAGDAVAEDLPHGRPDARDKYPIFPCRDGYVRICALGKRHWRNLFGLLGSPSRFSGPEWDEQQYRIAHAAELYPLYAKLVENLTREQCAELGRRSQVPMGGVRAPGEVLTSEHLRDRGVWFSLKLPDGSVGQVPNGFLELDGARAGIRSELVEASQASFLEDRVPAPAEPSGPVGRRPGPLAGLRVLDLGIIVIGAEFGRLFADLGADVVKVENRDFPDSQRPPGRMNANFSYGHRNKRSLGINLRDPEGKALFQELVGQADIVASNFRPGTMDRLGLDLGTLQAANPQIVVVESSAMGSWGSESRSLGYGPLVRAASGLTSVWRYPDRSDAFADSLTIYPDHAASRVTAVAALAQLIARSRRHRGGTVVAAQAETILAQLSELFLMESLVPGSFRARGNMGEYDAPYGVFPCAGDDEWCVITIDRNDQWSRLCELIGARELADDPDLARAAGRIARRAALDQAVTAWTSRRSPTEVMRTMQAHGVPAGAMIRPVDLPADPHLTARGYFTTLDQPDVGRLVAEGPPARFDFFEAAGPAPAPRFGEHTREVVHEWLGMGADVVADLVERGVLQE